MAHKSEIINTEKHPFIGVSWPVIGSKGNEYKVVIGSNFGVCVQEIINTQCSMPF